MRGKILTACSEPARLPRLAPLLLACAAMALPAALTGWAWLHDGLGPNPLEVLERDPGRWSLVWLLTALAIGPLRQAGLGLAVRARWRYGKRPSDWNWLIRLRRPAGLASFAYATLHLALYATLDLDLRWAALADDLLGKPYAAVGLASYLLLFPLALTSTDAWMKRLQRHWKRLHMLVFPAALLAVLHFILLSKHGIEAPFWYAAVLAGLLAWRAAQWRRGAPRAQDRIDGSMPARPPRP